MLNVKLAIGFDQVPCTLGVVEFFFRKSKSTAGQFVPIPFDIWPYYKEQHK